MKVKSANGLSTKKPKRNMKSKLKPKRNGKKLGFNKPQMTTTIEEVSHDSDDSIDNYDAISKPKVAQKATNQNGTKKKKQNLEAPKEEKIEDVTLNEGLSDEDDDDDEEMTGLNKDTLERLKQKDPDFYKYLQSHDKELLDFDEDDDADDALLDDEEEEADQDEGDDDDEGASKKKSKEEAITLNTVKQWRKVLQTQSSKADDLSTIKSIIRAFRKTVNQTSDTSGEVTVSSMSMLNPSVFNAIINTVLVDLIPALLRFLRLQNVLNKANNKASTSAEKDGESESAPGSLSQPVNQSGFFDPRRSRNWKRVQSSVKMYLTDVLKMLNSLSADARASFERHILELTPFYNAFPHLIKRLIRRSIDEWCGVGGTEDRNRVLAYLVLHRTIRVLQSNDHLTTNERQSMVNQILRKLYMSYVAVARNTKESSIAQISFMKNSLVELYRLDDQLAYQHAFIFIRQLAINLRSSFILKEKNSMKTVYNWQFVHSILLWTQLICAAHSQTDVLDPLISPLVMVITGTIKLLPTVKFIPLRFHLIRALIKLSAETGQFIPVLRYFLEIYSLFDPSKVQTQKSKKAQKKKQKEADKKEALKNGTDKKTNNKVPEKYQHSKAINFDVMLKVGKEQTTQEEFVQKVFEKIYTLCLQYTTSQSSSIAFPELVSIFLHQSRKFIQTIRSPKERTSMKQLMDKIQENGNFIVQKRKSVKFSVQNTANVTAWERQLKQSESTPLAKFSVHLAAFKASNASAKTAESTNEVDSMDKAVQEKFCAESKERTFNVQSDLKKAADDEEEEEVVDEEGDEEDDDYDEGEELDDEELAQLEDADDMDDDDDDDEEIEFGDDDDEVELTEEEFAKLQKKIEKEESKLRNLKGNKSQAEDNATETKKRKRKNNKNNKKQKKPRKLNNDLQLEGAFDMSSDED